MKKKMKKFGHGVIGMTSVGMLSGVGLTALGASGAPVGFGAGITQVGTHLPLMGNMMGASAAIGMMKNLQPKKK